MKKTIILLLIIFSSFCVFAKDKEKLELPSKVLILGQSGTFNTVFITLIDLSNNEIVILEYDVSYTMTPGLVKVYRTGMFVDPEQQMKYLGTDSPGKNKDKKD